MATRANDVCAANYFVFFSFDLLLAAKVDSVIPIATCLRHVPAYGVRHDTPFVDVSSKRLFFCTTTTDSISIVRPDCSKCVWWEAWHTVCYCKVTMPLRLHIYG